MSPQFFSGFTPFNSEEQTPGLYNQYKYTDYNSYIASQSSLIFEQFFQEQQKPVNISLAYVQRSSYAYKSGNLVDVMDQIFPLFIVIIYTLPFMYLLQRAVEEKQTKVRESMRMMGMIDSAYFTSWFIVYFFQILIVSSIMTLGSIFTLFPGWNFFLIFVYYFLYGISLFGMGLLFIAIFDTVRTASIGGIVLKIGCYYLRYALVDGTPEIVKVLVGIFPPLNLYNADRALWYLQAHDKISFSNIGFKSNGYSLGYFYIMSLFGFVFWLLFGLYITYIVPTEFGTNKHPWFCFRFRRRHHAGVNEEERRQLLIQQNSDVNSEEVDPEKAEYFERVGENLKELEARNEWLKIRNLTKIYPNGFKAVDELSLTMYSGQIFALLGHNGAGKTTTISMLTGLFSSTGGLAQGFGIDLLQDQDEARKIMGVWPQHNVLFPILTPTEHFDIFCDFKGVPTERREEAIQKCLVNVDLLGQKDIQSKNLSGGQQRKVSVGIAMLGDSKIVLLDEPTSGMDPTARRRLWDLLKNNKQNKIIILTTHYMEEADILGDRIAIMASGDAQCWGSSLFLKKKFGVGYNLTIDKTTQHNAPQIDEFIWQKIPGAIKLSEVSSEISYQLPNAAAGRFKNFFLEMDNQKSNLEIKSYGIGVTTLEEVFLKVSDGVQGHKNFDHASINASPEQKANDDYCLVDESVQGMSLRFLQLKAMIWIRLVMTFREFRIIFLEIFYPTILIVLSSIILALSTASFDKLYPLSVDKIPAHQTVFYGYESTVNPIDAQNFMNYFYNSGSFKAVAIDITFDSSISFGENLKTFDNYVMNHGSRTDNYFSVFIRAINQVPVSGGPPKYDIVTFIDPTQTDATGYAIQGTINSVIKDFSKNEKMSFSIKRGPFPKSKLDDSILKFVLTMLTVFSYSIALGIITSSIAGNLCKERADSLKHQQIVSGGSKFSYWLSIYIIDLLKFAIPGLSFIIIILSFDLNLPYYWLFDILCILSILPFTYLITFIIQKESIARNLVRLIHIFLGGMMAPAAFGFLATDNLKVIGQILKWGLKFNPTFCFGLGLTQISLGSLIDDSDNPDPNKNMEFSKAGSDIVFLVLQLIVYFLLIFLIENKFFINKRGHAVRMQHQLNNGIVYDEESKQQDILDPDVQEEERRVMALDPSQLEVRTCLLNKVYKDRSIVRHAVRNVSFGISFGECFALLGINGAGKTTTFKSLTGDVDPTSGEVHIGGYDVQNRTEYSSVRKLIGYCPQFDALFPNLTVKEHLIFYAHIKGVVPNMRGIVVERQLIEMGLEEYKNTHAGRLSGGNKRKLSVAMAMIGNPPIVFLDEPSTGMDPRAKRFMWDIIARISTLRKKSAVILTTHSMEEAEALSTKLGIMVDGTFKWYGTAQHIKNRYGEGYEIEIKVKIPSNEEITAMISHFNLHEQMLVTDQNAMNILNLFNANELGREIRINGLGDNVAKEFAKGGMKLRNFIEFIQIEKPGLALMNQLSLDFDYIVLIEHYGNSFKVKLPTFEDSLGVLFGQFEERYIDTYSIEEYSINQTSLEQIFNSFAKQQYTMAQNARVFRRNNMAQ